MPSSAQRNHSLVLSNTGTSFNVSRRRNRFLANNALTTNARRQVHRALMLINATVAVMPRCDPTGFACCIDLGPFLSLSPVIFFLKGNSWGSLNGMQNRDYDGSWRALLGSTPFDWDMLSS